MSPTLEQKLFDEFPQLFNGRKKPKTESLMCFGCDHGDGWFEIIYAMCKIIDSYVKNNNVNYEFVQIKEKFGTLRVYGSIKDDFIEGVVSMAEYMSSRICEITGKPGNLVCNSNNWYKTLSDDEAIKQGCTPVKVTI